MDDQFFSKNRGEVRNDPISEAASRLPVFFFDCWDTLERIGFVARVVPDRQWVITDCNSNDLRYIIAEGTVASEMLKV